MSADQAACVYPHKPQFAKIRFLKQSHNSIDVVLTCHCLLASPQYVVLFAHIIQPSGVFRKNK